MHIQKNYPSKKRGIMLKPLPVYILSIFMLCDIVLIVFLQICLDEAQMVECTTTKVGWTYFFHIYKYLNLTEEIMNKR